MSEVPLYAGFHCKQQPLVLRSRKRRTAARSLILLSTRTDCVFSSAVGVKAWPCTADTVKSCANGAVAVPTGVPRELCGESCRDCRGARDVHLALVNPLHVVPDEVRVYTYRGTSLIRKRSPPWDPHRAAGMILP